LLAGEPLVASSVLIQTVSFVPLRDRWWLETKIAIDPSLARNKSFQVALRHRVK
jgi:hypothetical protein